MAKSSRPSESPSQFPTSVPPFDVEEFARSTSPATERAMRILAHVPSLPPVLAVDAAEYEKLYEAIKGLR